MYRYREYSKIKKCMTFWSWIFWEWDSRKRWEGPYILIRVAGVRVLGFEFEREYIQKPYGE